MPKYYYSCPVCGHPYLEIRSEDHGPTRTACPDASCSGTLEFVKEEPNA